MKFDSYTLEGKTQDEVKEWYGYSDHSLKGGIQLLELVFDNELEAIDWVSDNTDKWYGAKAVQVKTDKGQAWVVGGWVDY